MPKATRQRIKDRGEVTVNTRAGGINVPAAVHASPMGGNSGRPIVSGMNRFAGSGFASLSDTFKQMAARVARDEAIADEEAKYQQRRAQAKADAAAERQLVKAERLEEARMLADQSLIAAKAGLKMDFELFSGIQNSSISSPEQVEELFDRYRAGFDGTASPQAQTMFYKLAVDSIGRALPALVEKKGLARTAEMLDAATDIVGSVIERENPDNPLSAEEFAQHYNLGRETYTANGGLGPAYDDLWIERYSFAAKQAAGTPKGDTYRDRLEKLNPGSQQAHLMRQEALLTYDKLAVEARDNEDKRLREGEAERTKSNHMQFTNAFLAASPDVQEQMLKGLIADPDAAEAKLGDRFGTTVEWAEEHIYKRNTREWQEKERTSAQETYNALNEMYKGSPSVTRESIENNPLILPHHKMEALTKWDSDARLHASQLAEFSAQIEAEIARKLKTRELSWDGGYSFDAQGNPEFLPHVKAAIRNTAEKFVSPTLTRVDLKDPDAVQVQDIAIRDAVQGAIKEISSPEFIRNSLFHTDDPDSVPLVPLKDATDEDYKIQPQRYDKVLGRAILGTKPDAPPDLSTIPTLPPLMREKAAEMAIKRNIDIQIKRREEQEERARYWQWGYEGPLEFKPSYLYDAAEVVLGIPKIRHEFDKDAFRATQQNSGETEPEVVTEVEVQARDDSLRKALEAVKQQEDNFWLNLSQ